jgi:hypothetical protein
MFGARKPPPFCPPNTTEMGTAGKGELSNGGQSWTEHFDLISEAAAAFKGRSHGARIRKTWLERGDSGVLIQPQLAESQLLKGGGWPAGCESRKQHMVLKAVKHGSGQPRDKFRVSRYRRCDDLVAGPIGLSERRRIVASSGGFSG